MNILDSIDESWHPCVMSQLYQEPLKTLSTQILPNISYQPSKENIFKVFKMPLKKVKVVILGQDPYPTPGHANGLAFANEVTTPKSLQIIYKEILTNTLMYAHSKEIDGNIHHYADINSWTEQGILLLNTALTVKTAHAGSHLKYWEKFTKSIVSYISLNQPCIWVFWGRQSQRFINYIVSQPFNATKYNRETIDHIPNNDDYNYILTAPHPAAELYNGGKGGFYGCDHFYKINRILLLKQQAKINW